MLGEGKKHKERTGFCYTEQIQGGMVKQAQPLFYPYSLGMHHSNAYSQAPIASLHLPCDSCLPVLDREGQKTWVVNASENSSVNDGWGSVNEYSNFPLLPGNNSKATLSISILTRFSLLNSIVNLFDIIPIFTVIGL